MRAPRIDIVPKTTIPINVARQMVNFGLGIGFMLALLENSE
jgi:hypothetical protein